MTLTTIQNDIQSFLGITIDANSRITSTEVLQWVNQAYRVAQSKLANANINYYLGEQQEQDTTADEGRYLLPDNFLAMKRMEIQYNDNEDKVRVTPTDINAIWSTLDPDSDPWSQKNPFYALWEKTFYIKPIPDETSSSWTTDPGNAIKMWFIERQADLASSTDVPALPEAYQHILAFEPTAKGLRKLKRFPDAKEYEALWRDGLSNMIADNTTKDKVKPMSFSVTRGVNRSSGIFRP
jgi:hypothetical protein